jgi:hypothetical protein
MSVNWFRRWGWFYIPSSFPGAIVTLLAVLFCATVFVVVDRHAHSVSDTLYGIFLFFACAFLLVDWMGTRTCGTTSHRLC